MRTFELYFQEDCEENKTVNQLPKLRSMLITIVRKRGKQRIRTERDACSRSLNLLQMYNAHVKEFNNKKNCRCGNAQHLPYLTFTYDVCRSKAYICLWTILLAF